MHRLLILSLKAREKDKSLRIEYHRPANVVAFALKLDRQKFIIESMAPKSKNRSVCDSKSRQTDEIQAAVDYGIDVSALIANVNRSCTERIVRHQIALNTAEELRKAREL